MPLDIPRVILVDTFNKEVTDSLMVADYFNGIGTENNPTRFIRLDTCGENMGEGVYDDFPLTPNPEKIRNLRGVTVESARKVKMALIENGHDNFELFLTSGMGKPEKAKAFMDADAELRRNTGYDLFTGVGIGELYPARFCTADIIEVDGQPLAKTGREEEIAYNEYEKILG